MFRVGRGCTAAALDSEHVRHISSISNSDLNLCRTAKCQEADVTLNPKPTLKTLFHKNVTVAEPELSSEA